MKYIEITCMVKRTRPTQQGRNFTSSFFVGSEFSGKMLGPTSVRVEIGKCEGTGT